MPQYRNRKTFVARRFTESDSAALSGLYNGSPFLVGDVLLRDPVTDLERVVPEEAFGSHYQLFGNPDGRGFFQATSSDLLNAGLLPSGEYLVNGTDLHPQEDFESHHELIAAPAIAASEGG